MTLFTAGFVVGFCVAAIMANGYFRVRRIEMYEAAKIILAEAVESARADERQKLSSKQDGITCRNH